MKLKSFLSKDVVHLEVLDETGLISPEIEAALPQERAGRPALARAQFAVGEPDVKSLEPR